MTAAPASRAQPLRPGDPRQLGQYTLLGRLGEGGMGIVYLAQSADGPLVALKMIRAHLANDADFRRRFRGEVDRARQVPPFCTAEVLDADPDHERPYLVVEYVDGPGLDTVVAERGPLTPANLHGLAIGVATALTAIHGAGVIHRDLKPSNVLLAPGHPKVIDFGIARAIEGTAGNTDVGQILGTAAYMAPERFGSTSATLTAAADVFAWGAVVAYAGTGRTPYGGDSLPAIAARIMTQEPNLDGLASPLRDLVQQALAKDPSARPTARELLDRLLVPESQRPVGLAAALARQPELLSAAEGAQAATDRHSFDAAAAPVTRLSNTLPGALPAPNPARRPRRWRPLAAAALALAVLIGAGVAGGKLAGFGPFAREADAGPGPSEPVVAAPTRPVNAEVVVTDPLVAPGNWRTFDDTAAHQATCAFDGALVVTKQTSGSYRCPGTRRPLTDFTAFVDVKLLRPGSCAGVWFRFDTGGYALRICAAGYYLVTHGGSDSTAVSPLRSYSFASPAPLNTAIRVGISAAGNRLSFYRDGRRVGTWDDGRFTQGRVVLGIFQEPTTEQPPYRVSFANIEVWTGP
jgi:hypothetical protein